MAVPVARFTFEDLTAARALQCVTCLGCAGTGLTGEVVGTTVGVMMRAGDQQAND